MPLRSSPIQVLGMSRRSLTLGVKSKTPHPYMWCYCSICRKTNGSGGYGINIAAERDTLEFVKGEDKMKIYQANIGTESKPKKSSNQRYFCSECGSHLYCYSEEWPQWIYPYASCIDTPLPKPKHVVHILLDSKASWVVPQKEGQHYQHYPPMGIEEWHKKEGVFLGSDDEEEVEKEKLAKKKWTPKK